MLRRVIIYLKHNQIEESNNTREPHLFEYNSLLLALNSLFKLQYMEFNEIILYDFT